MRHHVDAIALPDAQRLAAIDLDFDIRTGHSLMITQRDARGYSHLAPNGGREYLAPLDGTPNGNVMATEGRSLTQERVIIADQLRPQGDLRVTDTRGSAEILALLPLSSLAIAFVA